MKDAHLVKLVKYVARRNKNRNLDLDSLPREFVENQIARKSESNFAKIFDTLSNLATLNGK